MHRIGQHLQLGHGVDVAGLADDQCIAHQADFSGGQDVAYTNSGVLLFAGSCGVIVKTICTVQDGVVGVDQELDFSRGVDAGADDGKAGQGAVDAVQVAAHAVGDTDHACVQVSLQAGRCA